MKNRRIQKERMNDVHPNTASSKDQECVSASLAISRLTFPGSGFDSSEEPSTTRRLSLSFWPLSELATFSSPAPARIGACGVTRAIRRAITLATRFRFATLPLVFASFHLAICILDIFTPVAKRVAEPRFNIGPYHASGGAGRKFSPCFIMAQCSLSSAVRELWLNYRETIL